MSQSKRYGGQDSIEKLIEIFFSEVLKIATLFIEHSSCADVNLKDRVGKAHYIILQNANVCRYLPFLYRAVLTAFQARYLGIEEMVHKTFTTVGSQSRCCGRQDSNASLIKSI